MTIHKSNLYTIGFQIPNRKHHFRRVHVIISGRIKKSSSDRDDTEAPKARSRGAVSAEGARIRGEGALPSGDGVWGGAIPPPQKIFEVFCVKECILVHFSQRNISNILASSVPLFLPKAPLFNVSQLYFAM